MSLQRIIPKRWLRKNSVNLPRQKKVSNVINMTYGPQPFAVSMRTTCGGSL
jgi:hypothetical protein